jgi:two-component system, NtrC family, sensor kinase
VCSFTSAAISRTADAIGDAPGEPKVSSVRLRLGERWGADLGFPTQGPRLTLRAKGVIALLVLVLYEGSVWLYTAHERDRLLHIVQQMEQTNGTHEMLVRVNDRLAHSIVALQNQLRSSDRTALPALIPQDLLGVLEQLPAFRVAYPRLDAYATRLEQLGKRLVLEPEETVMVDLRDTEQELEAHVARLEASVQQKERSLTLQYQDLNHSLTLAILSANLLGLAVFGAVITIFFSKLAFDIRQLEARALAVVGDEGAKLRDVSRRDEVGGLKRAIDWMQAELQQRERLREISRQQSFHQEKMAAIGSVATTLAHEIGNPINSISGIAQHTIDAVRSGRAPEADELLDHAELTLRQTERIGAIVRQLSDLSSPRPQEPELLNLNELVQTTCSFVRYDKRFRKASLSTELDRGLPALQAVSDHLTQVLMNLLINAADALEDVEGRDPAIRVRTGRCGAEITLTVQDNGHGMSQEVLEHAFEQSFTTKPVGRGRGIGLYLCKKLMEEIEGRVELESTEGVGTTARVRLPAQTAA